MPECVFLRAVCAAPSDERTAGGSKEARAELRGCSSPKTGHTHMLAAARRICRRPRTMTRGLQARARHARLAHLPRALARRMAVREARRGLRACGQQRRVHHVRDRLALRQAEQAGQVRVLRAARAPAREVGAGHGAVW